MLQPNDDGDLGHGVDLSLVDRVNASAAAFFNSDPNLKQKYQTEHYGDPSVSSSPHGWKTLS